MTAIFDADRKYRWRLERVVQEEGLLAGIIMVNGSDADETENDHTVTKLIGFAKKHGWRGFVIANLFGAIGKDIKVLRTYADPIGPENDKYIEAVIKECDVLVVGWGTQAKLPEVLRKRWIDIVRIVDRHNRTMMCLGLCDDGHPKHPLMIGYDTPLIEWTPPWFPNRGKK